MKAILKTILIWSTILYIILLLTGIDSILEQGFYIESISLGIIVITLCYKFITKEDFYKYSGCKFINSLDPYYEEEDKW
jgi:hypothetical protein